MDEVVDSAVKWMTGQVADELRKHGRVPLAVVVGEVGGPDGAPSDRLRLVVPDEWTDAHVQMLLDRFKQPGMWVDE